MSSIEGIWLSHYEYGQGPGNATHFSDHHIDFAQEGGIWVGQSVQDVDGSEVAFSLTQQGDEFSGQWRERTSPDGHYEGREFSGLVLLLLQKDGAELNGMWLGANSRGSLVKAGSWTLKRLTSD